MGKHAAVRLLILTLALGAGWIAFTQQQDEPPLKLQEVRANLHMIVGPGGNIGVLVTDEGVVLIDDKFDRHVSEILAKVKSLTDKPVRYVLNTHHHGDHTGGNAKLSEQATIIAHENARANMRGSESATLPAVTFSEQTSVFLGGQEVRAIHFGRGHTNGDSIIVFPQHRVIHTGDLFVRGAPYIDYGAGGSALDWDATLDSVMQLEFDTVIPGHGPLAKREDLVQWKEDYETVRQRVRELSRKGVSVDEAAEQLKLDDLEGWSMSGLLRRSLPQLMEEMRR